MPHVSKEYSVQSPLMPKTSVSRLTCLVISKPSEILRSCYGVVWKVWTCGSLRGLVGPDGFALWYLSLTVFGPIRRDLRGAIWKFEFKRTHFDTSPEERTLETPQTHASSTHPRSVAFLTAFTSGPCSFRFQATQLRRSRTTPPTSNVGT